MEQQPKKKSAMKPFVAPIIALVVLLVIGIAAWILMPMLQKPQQALDPLAGYDPSAPATSNLNKIVDRSSKDVASVEITTNTGESFAIDYKFDEMGAQTATMRDSEGELPYSESDMTTLSGFVGLLVAFEEVGEIEDPSLFGFDNPQRTLKVNFTGGDPITLIIGNKTPINDGGVYIRRADRNIAYTIGGSTTEILMMTKQDYREKLLFTPPSAASDIKSVTLSRAGKEDIVVVRKDEVVVPQNQAEAAMATDYVLTAPIAVDANPDTINSLLLDKIATIKTTEIIEDYPQDLAKYGLDTPVKLKFTTVNDETVSLLIGDKTQSGSRYVMLEGVPSVAITESDIDLENLNYSDIIMQLIWFFVSDEVDTIDYELAGGIKHTFDLEVAENVLNGTYDGKEMTNKNPTNLFLRTVRFTLAGEYTSDMTYGERAVKATIRLTDGSTTTLELFKINERRFAAAIDGNPPKFYVGVDEVNELLEAFDLLAEGKDIPDMF